MIVGGSHDCDEEYGGEYIIVTNYSCPDCHATMLFYMSEEGQEGKNAYLEKRKPNFRKFPRLP